MLCFSHHPSGEICTNRCPDRPTCSKKRLPFLIEALDILPSDIEYGEENGFYFTSFKFYCVAPEAYINEMILSMLNQETPSIAIVPCQYCGKSVMMPTNQLDKFTKEHPSKYNKFTIAYCSKACQTKHLDQFREDKMLAFGSLKNHEYALIIHDADTSKRPKEEVKHIITGTKTEQRARCLRDKLYSVMPRGKRKFLTSNEVQMFLLKELSDNLKANQLEIRVTAWRVMKKCEQLFPMEISIKPYNGKDKEISLII